MTDILGSHWEGCWKAHGHHECAIGKVERMEASETVGSQRLAAAVKRIEELERRLAVARQELKAPEAPKAAGAKVPRGHRRLYDTNETVDAEEGLLRQIHDLKASIANMEQQLRYGHAREDNLEKMLAEARRERDELETRIANLDHCLRAALNREHKLEWRLAEARRELGEQGVGE